MKKGANVNHPRERVGKGFTHVSISVQATTFEPNDLLTSFLTVRGCNSLYWIAEVGE